MKKIIFLLLLLVSVYGNAQIVFHPGGGTYKGTTHFNSSHSGSDTSSQQVVDSIKVVGLSVGLTAINSNKKLINPTISAPLSYSSNTLSIPVATGSQNGYLSSSDWTTFNNKQAALTNPITGTGASGEIASFNSTSSITSYAGLTYSGSNLTISTGNINLSGGTRRIGTTDGNQLNIGTNNANRIIIGATSGNQTISNSSGNAGGTFIQYQQGAATSGTSNGFLWTAGSHTGQTAGAGVMDFVFNTQRTVTLGTGAVTNWISNDFTGGPSIAFAGTSTVSDAVTLRIGRAPIAGNNGTITRAWSLRVVGNAAFANSVYIGDTLTAPSARLHLSSTTEQFRSAYDASNYFSATTASTASTTFDLTASSGTPQFTFNKQVNILGPLTTSNIFTTNAAATTSGNLTISGSNTASTTTQTTALFGGSSTVSFRMLSRGSTNYTMTSGNAHASYIIGGQPVTEPSSGNIPVVSSLVIIPNPITNAGGTTDTTVTFKVTGAGSQGTNNLAVEVDQGTTYLKSGNLGVGVISPTERIHTSGNILAAQYKLSALNTAPSSASDTGTTGEIRIDANYIYICTATNTWKRVAIATW